MNTPIKNGVAPAQEATPKTNNRQNRITAHPSLQALRKSGVILAARGRGRSQKRIGMTDKEISDFARSVAEEALTTEGGRAIIGELLATYPKREHLLVAAWLAGAASALEALRHSSN